jgi:hypothetical protein
LFTNIPWYKIILFQGASIFFFVVIKMAFSFGKRKYRKRSSSRKGGYRKKRSSSGKSMSYKQRAGKYAGMAGKHFMRNKKKYAAAAALAGSALAYNKGMLPFGLQGRAEKGVGGFKGYLKRVPLLGR